MMSENTKNYKARLIHLITGLPEQDLKEAKYESNELSVSNKQDKVYKTDIIVRVDKHIINIEMNGNYYNGLIEKNGTYYHKLRSEQFSRGESYLKIQKVIQINIDNFKKFKGNKLVYKFMMLETETKELESEYLESYHIDLSYLKNKCYNETIEELEKICLLFVEEKDKIKTLIKGDNIMDEAYEELERLSKDKDIIGLYDAEKVAEKVLNTRLEGARLEGIEEGEKRGSEQKSLDIAKKMILKNISIQDISEITGLSKQQIENLK